MVKVATKVWLVAMVITLLPGMAAADVLSNGNYRLDLNVTNSFGGKVSNGSYQLKDSGGEGIVGLGSNSYYRLASGYVAEQDRSMQLSVIPSGLAAYYPFDTGQGAAVYDVSSNGAQGTLNGAGWGAGQLGQAVTFSGSQYVDVPNSTAINLTGTMAIEAWVKLTDSTTTHTIVAKTTGDGTTNNTYELRTQASTGDLQFRGFDTADRTITSTVAVPVGAWAHVAAVKTGGTVTLYVNGASAGSGSVSATTSNTNNLKIGGRDDLTDPFAGSIDDVRLYNRALSAAEVSNDYTAGSSGVTTAATIPAIVPGVSQTTSLDTVVRTDAPGYDLSLAEDHDLRHTDGTTTIAAIAGSIAAPAAWTEGSTKGLGFTVTAATQLEGKYGTSPNYLYAAIPTSSTAYHSRTGYTGGQPEVTSMQLREDVTQSQKSGSYSNMLTVTATMKP